MKDLVSNVKVSQVLAPAVRTADANGSSVDMKGYQSCMFVAHTGTAGDTLSGSVKIEFEVEESDDDVTFTDVADADLVYPSNTVVNGTNDGCFAVIDSGSEVGAYKVGYRGTKRYVRVVENVTGTHSTGTPSSVIAIQSHSDAAPIA